MYIGITNKGQILLRYSPSERESCAFFDSSLIHIIYMYYISTHLYMHGCKICMYICVYITYIYMLKYVYCTMLYPGTQICDEKKRQKRRVILGQSKN